MALAKECIMHDKDVRPSNEFEISRAKVYKMSGEEWKLDFPEHARTTPEELFETTSYLVQRANCDPMIGTRSEPSVLYAWSGPPDILNWLLRQDSFFVDMASPCEFGHSLYHSQISKLVALWTPERAHDIITVRDAVGKSVLHQALLELAWGIAWGSSVPCSNSEDDPHKAAVALLLENGCDVYSQSVHGLTPLDTILRSTHQMQTMKACFNHPRLDELLQWWFRTLADAQYDLEAYVQTELHLDSERSATRLWNWDHKEYMLLSFSKAFGYDQSDDRFKVISEAQWRPFTGPEERRRYYESRSLFLCTWA